MFSGMKLFYTFGDNIAPDDFPRIIHPSLPSAGYWGFLSRIFSPNSPG